MKNKNAPWNKPFYERLEQSKKKRQPNLMRAQGKRMYEVTGSPSDNADRPSAHLTSIQGSFGGYRKGELTAISSGRGGKSFFWNVETVKVQWMKPKHATLMSLKGYKIKEVDSNHEHTYNRTTLLL